MLLRFGVENLWSFRDRAELSFVGTALTDEPAQLIPHPATPHGVLPVLGVYGANASGKSNLIRALGLMQDEVRGSFKRDVGAPVPRVPFLLRKGAHDAPSRLDVDFTVGGDRLHYGFLFNDTAFVEEWLYLWRAETQRQSLLFHRQGPTVADWRFGPSLAGANRRIAAATRPEILFLSKAADENHPQLKGWQSAFVAALSIEQLDLVRKTELYLAHSPILAPENAELVRRLLRVADLGIDDLRVRDADSTRQLLVQELATQGLPSPRIDEFKRWLADSPDAHLIELGHRGEDGLEYLSPELESIGTQCLLSLLNPILDALRRGGLLVLDELGSGLHPKLVAEIVGLFTSSRSNPHGAQLLFTTHDSLIMDSLRRDEVLLVDKGGAGASTVRALSDYELRKRDDRRRIYERGLVGGTPAVGCLSDVAASYGKGR